MIGSSTYLTKTFYSLSRVNGLGIENFRVKIGTVHVNQDQEDYDETLSVDKYVFHPHWQSEDIALLKLQHPATLNQRVNIARIAEKRDRVGEHCVLAGWGRDSKGQSPEWLQEVRV